MMKLHIAFSFAVLACYIGAAIFIVSTFIALMLHVGTGVACIRELRSEGFLPRDRKDMCALHGIQFSSFQPLTWHGFRVPTRFGGDPTSDEIKAAHDKRYPKEGQEGQ